MTLGRARDPACVPPGPVRRRLRSLLLGVVSWVWCLLFSAHVQVVGAQQGVEPTAAGDAQRELVDVERIIRARLAELWAIPPGSVRIELPPDAPTRVDSVAIEPGSGDRWIATFVVGGGAVRRFVRVGHVQAVPVAVAAMPREHIIREEDLTMGSRIVWGPPVEAPPAPDGWVTHRRIVAGDALVEPAVRPPLFVRGGDEVEAVFVRAGVVLKVKAEALSSARSGQVVAVRMPSGKRMDGRAVAPGRVALDTGVSR